MCFLLNLRKCLGRENSRQLNEIPNWAVLLLEFSGAEVNSHSQCMFRSPKDIREKLWALSFWCTNYWPRRIWTKGKPHHSLLREYLQIWLLLLFSFAWVLKGISRHFKFTDRHFLVLLPPGCSTSAGQSMSLFRAMLPNLIYLLKRKLEWLTFHIQCVQTFSVLSHPPRLPGFTSVEFRAAFAVFIHFHLAILSPFLPPCPWFPSILHLITTHLHSSEPCDNHLKCRRLIFFPFKIQITRQHSLIA